MVRHPGNPIINFSTQILSDLMHTENLLIKTSVILLAGGTGSRMDAPIPKQFLSIDGKAIALHSFEIFQSMPEVAEIVIVCDPSYQKLFTLNSPGSHPLRIAFALPGQRRQDSVYHGLQQLSSNTSLVCIHDSARPFIDAPMVRRTLAAAETHGAATTGMPMKYTVKESTENGFVKRTLPRTNIWEIQTPQAIKTHLLKQGFKKAIEEDITVTDDVSLVELFNLPVKLIEGSYSNLKITTQDDLAIAEQIIEKNKNQQEKESLNTFLNV